MTVIRNATVKDAQAIQYILNTSWFSTYKDIFTTEELTTFTSKWHNLDKLTMQISGTEYTYLVAEQNNSVIGVCRGYLLNINKLGIEKLYVLPEYKGLGVGSKLLNAIVQRYKNIRILELEVVKQNIQAIKFYEKQGFAKTKEVEFEVAGNKVPCYVMEKHL